MLPNTISPVSPFDVILAATTNEMIENIEALSDGSGIEAGAITPGKLDLGANTVSVATSETTTSTSYTNLATTGPAVTVTIGANGLALLAFGSRLSNNVIDKAAFVSFALSGANTLAANDANAMWEQVPVAGGSSNVKGALLLTGLTPGSTTFTLKYRTEPGTTASFQDRYISVVPL